MLIYISLALTVVLSYGQLLLMYFNRDDYTTFYYLQHNVLARFPYQFNTVWLGVLYPVVGLNPFFYYLLGIILYFTATVLCFKFIFKLTGHKAVAFFSALVFASGYIGQDSMVMFASPGFPSLLGLNFILISLLLFAKYQEHKRLQLFLLSILLILLALSVASARYFTSFLLLTGLELVYYQNREKTKLFLKTASITLISITTYLILSHLFNNKIPISGSTFYSEFNPFLFLNNFGSFWNLFFPTFLQGKFLSYLRTLTPLPNFLRILLEISPSLVFSSLTILFTFKLYPKLLHQKLVWLFFLLSIATSIILLTLASYTTKDYLDQVSTKNGIIFSFLLLHLLIFRISYSVKFLAFAIIAFISSISMFALFSPGTVFESTHRYLFPSVLVPPLFLLFFITKPLFTKNSHNLRYAYLLFLLPAFLLFTTHTISAIKTQNEIVIDSGHTKRIYRDLLTYIPAIKDKTIIYIEGSTPKLELAVGSASRVGLLPSEAAFAIHYNVTMDKIILPKRLKDIPTIASKENIPPNQVFTFIYDGTKLEEILISSSKP